MNLRQAYELEKLSRAFFSMDVLLLGNKVWVRSYLPVSALLFITQYFITAASQMLLNLILLPVQFFLIQKAAEFLAQKRFDLKVLDSCWWSIWWRATLYTVAIGLVVAMAIMAVIMPLLEDTDSSSLTAEEISARDPLNTRGDSVILFLLFYVIASFLAIGYATIKAFRVSCIKTRQCPQHAGSEMIFEEEREDNSGQKIAPPRTGPEVEAPVPANQNKYAPPPGYRLQQRENSIANPNEFTASHAVEEGDSEKDLRRYMPPEITREEPQLAEESEVGQPTDLVGAAPGMSSWQKRRRKELPDSTDISSEDTELPGTAESAGNLNENSGDTKENGS